LALPGGASVFTFTERINSVAWLDRGLLLVQPTSRGTRMRLYDPLAQRDWGKFPPLTDDLSAATSSGDLLVAPARNGAVFVRDLRTGASAVLSQTHAAPRAAPLRLDAGLLPEAQPTRAPAPSASRPQAVAGLALHTNGNILVSSTLVLRSDQGQDGAPAALRLGTEVTLWNLGRAQGQVLLTYTSDAPRSEVALSPELNLVAVISETHAVVLDALTGETRWDWEAHTNTIKDLQWRPLARWGGRGLRPLLITSSGDFTVRVWDIEQQSEILRLTHTTGVDLAAANDDGSYILTVDQNGVLHWWQTWLGDSSGLVATAAKVQTRPLSAEQEMAFQGRRQGE
jgi:WD40 repeat protein